MPNVFGNKSGIIGSIDLLFASIYVLGAFVFRKFANDNLGTGFSVIGASAVSCLLFIILKLATNLGIKYLFAIGLIGWIAGGFLLAEIIGDGEAG